MIFFEIGLRVPIICNEKNDSNFELNTMHKMAANLNLIYVNIFTNIMCPVRFYLIKGLNILGSGNIAVPCVKSLRGPRSIANETLVEN